MAKQQKSTLTTTQRLTLFVQKAHQMKRRSAFNSISSYEAGYTITWEQGSNLQVTNLNKPESESFRSYLIDFRHFIANESPIQLGGILNLSVNHARHIAFREQMISLQADWKEIDKDLPDTYRDTPEGQVIVHTGKDLFLLWLNGTIFHSDVEAEAYFESMGILKDIHEVDYAKHIGLCSNFIVHLAGVINTSLNANRFDLLNEFSPHVRAKVVATVADNESKAAAIRFWKGTRKFVQELCICDDHDQDPVIVVTGYEDGITDLKDVTVELRGCCPKAIDTAALKIKNSLDYIDCVERHGLSPTKVVQILELEVTNETDINNIKAALDDYKRSWRKKVRRLRCQEHGMPPGARAFGVDMYHQGGSKNADGVYLQGCCTPFMEQVLKTLR